MCIRLVDTRALARNRKAIEQGDADADIIVDGCISMEWTRREKNDSTAMQMCEKNRKNEELSKNETGLWLFFHISEILPNRRKKMKTNKHSKTEVT